MQRREETTTSSTSVSGELCLPKQDRACWTLYCDFLFFFLVNLSLGFIVLYILCCLFASYCSTLECHPTNNISMIRRELPNAWWLSLKSHCCRNTALKYDAKSSVRSTDRFNVLQYLKTKTSNSSTMTDIQCFQSCFIDNQQQCSLCKENFIYLRCSRCVSMQHFAVLRGTSFEFLSFFFLFKPKTSLTT